MSTDFDIDDYASPEEKQVLMRTLSIELAVKKDPSLSARFDAHGGELSEDEQTRLLEAEANGEDFAETVDQILRDADSLDTYFEGDKPLATPGEVAANCTAVGVAFGLNEAPEVEDNPEPSLEEVFNA